MIRFLLILLLASTAQARVWVYDTLFAPGESGLIPLRTDGELQLLTLRPDLGEPAYRASEPGRIPLLEYDTTKLFYDGLLPAEGPDELFRMGFTAYPDFIGPTDVRINFDSQIMGSRVHSIPEPITWPLILAALCWVLLRRPRRERGRR